MCYITATELKNHLGHYMELSQKEIIYVTKNNKICTVLCPYEDVALNDFLKTAEEIAAEADPNVNFDDVLFEEIMKR